MRVMSITWSQQPFKTAFAVFFWAQAVLYLAACWIAFLYRPFHPVADWNHKTALGTRLLRKMFEYLSVVRSGNEPIWTPVKSGERFMMIDPPGKEAFAGVLSSSEVSPTQVAAVWLPAPIKPWDPEIKSRKVCIHVVGGAFVLGFDMENGAIAATEILIEGFGATNVHHISYRLANERNPFPAALQDVLTSYRYVLGLGIPPEKITLVGDSAGGNLVIAFLRYLETSQTRMPCPGSVLSFSPWIDVTEEGIREWEASSGVNLDPLCTSLLEWGVDAYRPKNCHQEVLPYIVPRRHPFKATTPLFISAGAREGFFNSIHDFAQKMSQVEGNRVMFHVAEHMPHDYFILWPITGTRAEAIEALGEAKTFVNGFLR